MAGKKSTKELVKFCRIFQWVEAQDKDLADAIRDLCMEGALSAGRRSGTTFLFPTAGVRKEIVKKAYSADAEEAVRLIDAHIVQSPVRTAAEFKLGVGTRLGIKLEVESASGSVVTLKGGAKLKVAKDFLPLRKDNIAVWEVESGEVPLEGPAFEAPKSRRGELRLGGYDGGGYDGGDPTLSYAQRRKLAEQVEKEFDECMRRDRCSTEDPYLTYATSLLNFLSDRYPQTLEAVRPIIDRDPAVTFYLLVEPYKTMGTDFVLGDGLLFGPDGWNRAINVVRAISEFQSYFEQRSGPADPAAVRKAVDEVRMQIQGDDGHHVNKVRTPKGVQKAYTVLISNNQIGGVGPILPAETIGLLPGAKKLWQDELRFMLHAAFEELRKHPAYSPGQFKELLSQTVSNRCGNNYETEIQLANGELLNSNADPQQEFATLLKFLNSSDFLYVSVPDSIVGGAWGDIPTTSTPFDPHDLSVYNAEASKKAYLTRVTAAGLDAPRQLDAGTAVMMRRLAAPQ